MDPLTSEFPAVGIERHARLDSTNARGRELLLAGTEQDWLIIADTQTAGRGRHGRTWESPAEGGALLMTLALRPSNPPRPTEALHLVAAAAVCEAVVEGAGKSILVRPAIKWPNDVLLGGKKLAGVLAERVGEAGIVIGIGVNLLGKAEDYGTAARAGGVTLEEAGLPIEVGENVRDLLVVRIVRPILALARRGDDGAWQAALEQWRAWCDTLGRWIAVSDGQDRLEGTAVDLEPDGTLLLRLAGGGLHRVSGGEVTVVRQEI